MMTNGCLCLSSGKSWRGERLQGSLVHVLSQIACQLVRIIQLYGLVWILHRDVHQLQQEVQAIEAKDHVIIQQIEETQAMVSQVIN